MADYSFENFEPHKVETGESLDSLARSIGITWRELAQFNWGTSNPTEINRCLHEYVGCWQRTKDGKNYIFTSDDDPGIVYLPQDSPLYHMPAGRSYVVEVKSPPLVTTVEVQTVDEFGDRVPNIDLVLESQDGHPSLNLTTDGDAYGKLTGVLAGKYAIRLQKDNGPTWFLKNCAAAREDSGRPDYGDYTEAVLDTRNYVTAVTRVVVQRDASDAECLERNLRKTVYNRPERHSETIYGRVKAKGKDEPVEGRTRRALAYCADNLAIAAGWLGNYSAVNIAGMVSNVLPDFFKAKLPTAAKRGFYVLVIEFAPDYDPANPEGDPGTPRLTFYDEGGVQGPVFTLSALNGQGLAGAYVRFEDRADESGSGASDPNVLVDVLEGTYKLWMDASAFQSMTGLDDNLGFYFETYLDDRAGYFREVNARVPKVQVVYWMPNAVSLAAAALHGGTGRLEDYPADTELNSLVHQRNIKVTKHIAAAYRTYAGIYEKEADKIAADVRKAAASGDRVSDEAQDEFEDRLRELGPPLCPYQMPVPANATDGQLKDIMWAYSELDEVGPWRKIAELLDSFAKVKTQGIPFFRIKPKWGTGELADKLAATQKAVRPSVARLMKGAKVGVEVEACIDIQIVDGEIRTITSAETHWVVSVNPGEIVQTVADKTHLRPLRELKVLLKRTIPVEVEVKGKIEYQHDDVLFQLGEPESASVKILDRVELEASTDGAVKFTFSPVPGGAIQGMAEVNAYAGEWVGGLKISGKGLAKSLDKWAEDLEGKLKDPSYLEAWPSMREYAEQYGGSAVGITKKVTGILEQFEIELVVGYVGAKQESVLAVASMAPGFFQLRGIKHLLEPKTLWNELNFDEHISLASLGWDSDSWDMKYQRPALVPASVRKSPLLLEPEERVAIVHLGFRSFGEYGEKIQEALKRNQ